MPQDVKYWDAVKGVGVPLFKSKLLCVTLEFVSFRTTEEKVDLLEQRNHKGFTDNEPRCTVVRRFGCVFAF